MAGETRALLFSEGVAVDPPQQTFFDGTDGFEVINAFPASDLTIASGRTYIHANMIFPANQTFLINSGAFAIILRKLTVVDLATITVNGTLTVK